MQSSKKLHGSSSLSRFQAANCGRRDKTIEAFPLSAKLEIILSFSDCGYIFLLVPYCRITEKQKTTMEVFVHMPASPIVVLPANKGVSPGHFSCTPCNSYPESCSEDVTCTTDFSERTFDDTTTATFADIEWHELSCIRHLTRGGSSLVYSARYHGRPVVVKTLRPQLRESDSAVSEFESELGKFWVQNIVWIV